jgi:large subunit ribosomal protein L33
MREIIKLTSTGKTKAGKPTGTFRTTTKNKRLSPEKRKSKHYDPKAYNAKTDKCGMHVIFEETKLS